MPDYILKLHFRCVVQTVHGALPHPTALVHMVQRSFSGDPVEGISRSGNRIVLPGEVFMNVNRPEGKIQSV